MKNWKRYLSIAMTLVMLLGVLPTAAFAEGETPEPQADPTITLTPSTAAYTGGDITVTVAVSGLTGYAVTCPNAKTVSNDSITVVNAGTYTVTATPTEGNAISTTLTIQPMTVAEDDLDVTINAVTYGTPASPVVKLGDKALSAETDYDVICANTNVGTQDAVISLKGNYSGSKTVQYTINAKSMDGTAIQPISAQTYTGSAITPVVVKDGNKTLTAGTDYDVTYANNTNIAKADAQNAPTAKVTFKGNYSGGPFIKTFAINPIPTTGLSLAVAQPYAYNEKAPAVTVANGKTTLTTGFDLSYKVKNGAALGQAPVVPGEYTVTATFDDTYAKSGENNFTLTQDYTISKGTITDSSVTTAYDFCHSNDTPVVTVTVGGRTLTADTDYTVANTDAGSTRTITVTGKGNYEGTGTKTQTILPDTAPTISGVATNGTYHTKPTVTVTGENLDKVYVKQGTGTTETEYTKAQAEAGFVLDFAASAYTIRAVDNAGKSYTLATNVTVSRKSITFDMVTVTGVDDVTYDGTAKTATSIVVKDGTETLELGADKDYTVSYTNNTHAGTATITITGTGNYMGTVSKTFTIKPKALTSTALSGIVDKTYTGSPIEQENLTVKDEEKTLEKGSDKDYTVHYSNNTNPGTAKVTVILRGNYTGTLEKTFVIGQDLSALIDNIKALAGDSDLSYGEKQEIKQLKAAYDALSAADKATVDSEVGSALMTSFKNKASAARFKLLNLPSLGYYRYTKGTSSNVVIKIDAEYSRTLVTEIRMGKNLTVIEPDDYEVKEGSVEVTLKSSYLKQIKTTGKYNLYIDLLDTETGHTETVQTVVRILPATDIPQSGDPFKLTLWIGLLGASVLVLAGLGVYEVVKKKKNSQKRLEAAMDMSDEPSDEASADE